MDIKLLKKLAMIFTFVFPFQSNSWADVTRGESSISIGMINSSVFPIKVKLSNLEREIKINPFSFETIRVEKNTQHCVEIFYDLRNSYNGVKFDKIESNILAEGTELLSRRLKKLAKRPGMDEQLMESARNFYSENSPPDIRRFWQDLSFKKTGLFTFKTATQVALTTSLFLGANVATGGVAGMSTVVATVYTYGGWAVGQGVNAGFDVMYSNTTEKMDKQNFEKSLKKMVENIKMVFTTQGSSLVMDITGSIGLRKINSNEDFIKLISSY